MTPARYVAVELSVKIERVAFPQFTDLVEAIQRYVEAMTKEHPTANLDHIHIRLEYGVAPIHPTEGKA